MATHTAWVTAKGGPARHLLAHVYLHVASALLVLSLLMGGALIDFSRGDPWFEDGNVILRTHAEPTDIGFKVHRGVLARSSELFESMFSLPQPSSEDNDGEECPVVPVYDDPTELGILVKAIYDGIKLTDDSIKDFFVAIGILKLASKYLIPRLRAQAIAHLARSTPFLLREHDEMVERALERPRVDGLTYPYIHPLHVFKIAREYNVRALIPMALYSLAGYQLDEILRGEHPKLQVEHPSRPASHLDGQDLRDYTLMSQHRFTILFEFHRDFLPSQWNHPGCHNPPNCNRAFSKLKDQFARSWQMRTSPLHFSAVAMQQYQDSSSLCDLCRNNFRTRAKIHRQKMWDGLPHAVGLPSWDVLTAELDFATEAGAS